MRSNSSIFKTRKFSYRKNQKLISVLLTLKSRSKKIAETLSKPDEVRRSQSRQEARLYYQLKAQVGSETRYICVIVKVTAKQEELIVSAMTTSSLKDGEVLYRRIP